ncbi:MAG: hypothetical protein FWF69_04880 [Firmicutes bacterium]|nr:hypothetical protein [Bacillota bacterium]
MATRSNGDCYLCGAPLSSVGAFLRKIWLECCGHLSAFVGLGGQISKTCKIGAFAVGDKFGHEYDFGSTTETTITVVALTKRAKQREAARQLAGNVPPQHQCAGCGKPAVFIRVECVYHPDNPFYCAKCAHAHEHKDMMLPVTNSPRMGECGYESQLDTFAFSGRGGRG